MNLAVIFGKVGKAARGILGTTGLLAKKHAPELMLAAGGGSLILTIVETVKATNKTHDILEYKEEKMALIQRESEENDGYTVAICEADMRTLNRDVRIELAKVWWKVGMSTIMTLIFFGGVYKIVNGRLVCMTAAYDGLDQFTKQYRQNVRDEFGNEVDWRMAHSIKAEEMEERRRALEAADEEKKKKKRLRGDEVRTQYMKGVNNQIFDANSSTMWKRWWMPSQAIDFVCQVEKEIQDRVEINGFCILNWAYERLGMPCTAEGAIVGWIKRPKEKHDQPGHLVSLGFANDETPEEEIRRILGSPSNDEIYIWLQPNCDGVIYNLIDTPFSQRR